MRGVIVFDGAQRACGFAAVQTAFTERLAARSVHVLFLLLMVVIPALGSVISTSAGDGVSMFGLFEVPALVQGGRGLGRAGVPGR